MYDPSECMVIFFIKRKADAHEGNLVVMAMCAAYYVAVVGKIQVLKFAIHHVANFMAILNTDFPNREICFGKKKTDLYMTKSILLKYVFVNWQCKKINVAPDISLSHPLSYYPWAEAVQKMPGKFSLSFL